MTVIATAGCFAESEERTVTYENQTGISLTLVSDGDTLATLGPGETTAFRTQKSLLPDHILAIDAQGVTRIDKIVTWQDLQADNFRVVLMLS